MMKISYISKQIFLIVAIFQISKASAQINQLTPSVIVGGIGQILTISGNGFGNAKDRNNVCFLQENGLYMDTSIAKKLKYNSWSNTKIELEMPVAFTGKIKINIGSTAYISNDTLKVRANLGYRNVNPLDFDYLYNQNSIGGFTWHMHRTYFENPDARAAIEAVFKEIRCKTGANFILAKSPSDATLTLGDTINLIAPDPKLNAVGYNDKLWSSCILGATTFYGTKNLDIRLSTQVDWYFGSGKMPNGKVKFRYVLMHELCHALGLGHVNEIGQTMYPSVSFLPSDNWSMRDSITTEEKIAISYFVERSKTFAFRGCGYVPFNAIANCSNVYGSLSDISKISASTNDIKIYPNPGNGIYTIKNNSINLNLITIYNVHGKLIFKTSIGSLGSEMIDITSMPQGMYILKTNSFDDLKSSQQIVFFQ